jgi:hypothetical protein
MGSFWHSPGTTKRQLARWQVCHRNDGNFYFGAIWCDLVRIGAIGGGEFKVQGSKFKVQGPARNWKRQELPAWAALRPDQTLLEAYFHFYWV